VPIRLIIKNDHVFTPEEANVLVSAFEDALRELKLADREDPLTLLVAKHIVELAKAGERDSNRLRELTVQKIGPRDATDGG
jgi:hypothetical protein